MASVLKPVTYIISMQEEMDRAASGKNAKTFDKNDKSYRKNRNRQHLFESRDRQGHSLLQRKVDASA